MAHIDVQLLSHMCGFKYKKPKLVYLNNTLFLLLSKVNKLVWPDWIDPTYWFFFDQLVTLVGHFLRWLLLLTAYREEAYLVSFGRCISCWGWFASLGLVWRAVSSLLLKKLKTWLQLYWQNKLIKSKAENKYRSLLWTFPLYSTPALLMWFASRPLACAVMQFLRQGRAH